MNSRLLALQIIQETMEEGGMSHRLLQKCFRTHPELEGRERRFITGLVHGTISRALELDDYLGQISRRPPEKLKPFLRNILRMSLFQLLYMDRIPSSAVCNEAVKLVRHFAGEGLTGYANGVLRTAARGSDWKMPEGAAALSLPEELYQYLSDLYGQEETERLGRYFLEPAPLWGRINSLRTSFQELSKSLAQEGYKALPGEVPGAVRLQRSGEEALPLESVSAIRKGWLQLQDISAQLAVMAADPRPGQKVLDLCAAPGGKSLQAADLMEDKGELLACDISEDKRRLIEENCFRNGCHCIKSALWDARVFDPEKEGAFDLVIADLPCSGLGVAGRKPEIKYRAGLKEIRELAALQRDMLEHACRYIKPGGTLLYATCTISREENEENARWLKEVKGLRPKPLALGLAGIKREAQERSHLLQLLPGDLGGDGFFISLFTK